MLKIRVHTYTLYYSAPRWTDTGSSRPGWHSDSDGGGGGLTVTGVRRRFNALPIQALLRVARTGGRGAFGEPSS